MSMILTADRVITGDGKTVIEEGAVVLEGGRIRAVGKAEALCGRYAGETACLKGCTLMPGMIDLHTHIGYYYGLKMERRLEENRMLRVLWIGRRMEETLRAGVTTIRDMSSADGIGTTLREAAVCGFLRTPRILTSLKGLCITGGHGWGMKGAVEEVDGTEEIRKAVRRSIRDGADWIKLLDSEAYRGEEFSQEELNAAVREGLSENAAYLQDTVDTYRENFRKLYDTGVTVAVGTDTDACCHPEASPVYRECGCMVQYGLKPLEAIACATANGAKALGMQDSIGLLAEGYLADIIAVEGNPAQEIGALGRIAAVWQEGTKVYESESAHLCQ